MTAVRRARCTRHLMRASLISHPTSTPTSPRSLRPRLTGSKGLIRNDSAKRKVAPVRTDDTTPSARHHHASLQRPRAAGGDYGCPSWRERSCSATNGGGGRMPTPRKCSRSRIAFSPVGEGGGRKPTPTLRREAEVQPRRKSCAPSRGQAPRKSEPRRQLRNRKGFRNLAEPPRASPNGRPTLLRRDAGRMHN